MAGHSFKPSAFNPDKDIPDLSGRVIFITGGTSGLGKQTVIELSRHNPEHIYFSGRSSKTGDTVVEEVKSTVPSANLTFVALDLASLDSIHKAIKDLNLPKLDILICNAGIMAVPAGLTKDGYEIQFGTNHVGHALLIKLLIPTLLRNIEDESNVNSGRIVILTSEGFALHPRGGVAFKDLRTTQDSFGGPWIRYGQSKLANILYAAEIARRYRQITSVSIHPGVINTPLVGNLSLANRILIHTTTIGQVLSLEQGAYNTIWGATADKKNIINGEFYVPVGKLGPHKRESKNAKLAKELWEWTEKELSGYNM